MVNGAFSKLLLPGLKTVYREILAVKAIAQNLTGGMIKTFIAKTLMYSRRKTKQFWIGSGMPLAVKSVSSVRRTTT